MKQLRLTGLVFFVKWATLRRIKFSQWNSHKYMPNFFNLGADTAIQLSALISLSLIKGGRPILFFYVLLDLPFLH